MSFPSEVVFRSESKATEDVTSGAVEVVVVVVALVLVTEEVVELPSIEVWFSELEAAARAEALASSCCLVVTPEV